MNATMEPTPVYEAVMRSVKHSHEATTGNPRKCRRCGMGYRAKVHR